MKPEIKYFNVAGRAEALRIMIHAASSSGEGGFDWTDTRIGHPKWPEEKKLAPLGGLPTVSGLVDDADTPPFCQTPALATFFARQAGFYPKDGALDALVVDEALQTMNELADKIPFFGFADEADKKAQREAFQANEMTPYFKFLESRIQTFGDGKRFVKSCWTVADGELIDCVFQKMITPNNFVNRFSNIFSCCFLSSLYNK
jgi:hypothetical protein